MTTLNKAIKAVEDLYNDKSITNTFIDAHCVRRFLDVLYETEDAIKVEREAMREEQELRNLK
jgi:hypothetical protein